jgi:hypothetical protein
MGLARVFGTLFCVFTCACGAKEASNGFDPSSDAGDEGGPILPVDAGVDGADAGPPGAVLLLGEADRELTAMKSSSYTHDTFVEEIKGVFNYDCSGFVGYAMAKVIPDALETVDIAMDTRRPDAATYQAFFASLAAKPAGRWRSVSRAVDLMPGDVIAWLEPKSIQTTNTGHVMIVHAAVGTDPAHPDAVVVPVIDSTESPHGPGDSRVAPATGLGMGTIVLHVDGAGAPTGYQWSNQTFSTEYDTPVAMGRLR